MNLLSKSNLSLMKKIVLAFVAYISMILIVFSIIVVMIDRSQVKSISDGYSEDLLEAKNFIVSQWVQERIKDIEVLALTDEVKSMDTTIAINLLKEAVDHHDQLYWRFYIVDIEGNKYDTLGIQSKVTDSFDFTQHKTEGYEVIITEPIIDATFNYPSIEILVPIESEGQVIGILGSTVRLKDLNKLVSKSTVGGSGYSWILDGDARIVSHIDEDMITKEILNEDPEAEFSELQSLVAEFLETDNGRSSYKNDVGEVEYVVYSQVDGPVDWTIIVSLYQSDVYSTVTTLVMNLGLIFIIVVMLSVGVSWFLAKDVTAPIQTLIDVTTKFTTGVKGIRANVDSKDEIGALAQSFNNMADTIVAHTDNLEELITERTSTLADLNYQIVSRNKELGTMNTELEKTNNTLHELASKDMLTGLYNRHEFQRELQKTMELVNDGREENFALLFIDLDNFKYYNDTFSHEIGDFLLQSVADILSSKVRGNDVVGRYGGDEFVILLREGDYEIAKTIAQRIHQAILDSDGFKAKLQKKLNADVKIMGKNKLSSSIGIVKYMKSMNLHNAEDLLTKADETMYKAKKQGKSRVVVG